MFDKLFRREAFKWLASPLALVFGGSAVAVATESAVKPINGVEPPSTGDVGLADWPVIEAPKVSARFYAGEAVLCRDGHVMEYPPTLKVSIGWQENVVEINSYEDCATAMALMDRANRTWLQETFSTWDWQQAYANGIVAEPLQHIWHELVVLDNRLWRRKMQECYSKAIAADHVIPYRVVESTQPPQGFFLSPSVLKADFQ